MAEPLKELQERATKFRWEYPTIAKYENEFWNDDRAAAFASLIQSEARAQGLRDAAQKEPASVEASAGVASQSLSDEELLAEGFARADHTTVRHVASPEPSVGGAEPDAETLAKKMQDLASWLYRKDQYVAWAKLALEALAAPPAQPSPQASDWHDGSDGLGIGERASEPKEQP